MFTVSIVTIVVYGCDKAFTSNSYGAEPLVALQVNCMGVNGSSPKSVEAIFRYTPEKGR